ncbi:MAG: tRNA (guanosine(37)-N1)-methyltransferase TrmD [Nitrospirae bacterium]|nr:tRNA (guanosine(37)-N1)-methyltransferase TrmD [Nitrospirota bacterium]
MKCDILTIFPVMISSVLNESILKRAQEKGLFKARVLNIRDYAADKHRMVDDYPYGGGAGMVMKPEPIFAALDQIKKEDPDLRIILVSPQGRTFNHNIALDLSREKKRLVFICGHYEGIDERVKAGAGAEEISIGDYILTGGELAALVIIDASVRLIPGVLGDEESARCESFCDSLLDYPHYTRPPEFMGMGVPDVLLSGNHEEIRRWRRMQAIINSYYKRPDLLKGVKLTDEDKKILDEIRKKG